MSHSDQERYVFAYSTLEGILRGVNGLEDKALLELIKERCGVDLSRPQKQYPTEVGAQIIELIREVRFPNLSEREGLVEMGRATARGYNQTIVGRVLFAPLKFLSPEKALRLLAKAMDKEVGYGERTLVKIDEQHYILQFRDDPGQSPVVEGIILELLSRMKLPDAVVEAQTVGPHAFDIKISW